MSPSSALVPSNTPWLIIGNPSLAATTSVTSESALSFSSAKEVAVFSVFSSAGVGFSTIITYLVASDTLMASPAEILPVFPEGCPGSV